MVNGKHERGLDNMTKANLKNILAAVRDIINRSSEIGIRKAQAAEKRADNAQTAANAAQTTADNAQSTANAAQTAADNAQSTANAAQTAADNAQSTANAAQTAADNALPLSGGVIEINSGGSVATLKLNEFVSVAGATKRGIQIGGYGAYGNPILEVEHNDIAIYDKLSQKRIGGLNSTELFLKAKNSEKIFKITVDDSGTLSATEVTA